MTVTVNQPTCVACGICVKSCPEPGAITRNRGDDGGNNGKQRVSINPALCKMCLLCVSACPKKAIVAED
ncbi:MAG: 4Fe-4S binding protein [Chitinispirillales bacterium]|jgi:formate hydrogenlyase subunit 6/NADH:ubiquinone oxidoreductase subunit I|nr:4Fe-4S binding protein [Chitinispirillales bacterium]